MHSKNHSRPETVCWGRWYGTLKSRGAIHTLAQAGMDFIMICTEHSAYNLETVVDLCDYAHTAGMTPVVRIPDS